MTSGKALIYGVAAAILLAAAAPVLGDRGGAGYATVTQPALLFLASLLALRVSVMYRSDMRALFASLGAFLLLLGLVNVTPLVDEMAEAMPGSFFRALLAYQLFTYLFLMAATFLAVRITGLGRIGLPGRAALAAVAVLAVVIVARSFPTFDEIAEINNEAAVIYLVIRALDVLAMVGVAPAVALYVQSRRAQHQESLTFAVIGLGITGSLVLVYLYEIASGEPLFDIAVREYQRGTVLDALYIFGYAALVAGLFAHWKHQEWSLQRLDAALSGEPV